MVHPVRTVAWAVVMVTLHQFEEMHKLKAELCSADREQLMHWELQGIETWAVNGACHPAAAHNVCCCVSVALSCIQRRAASG